MVDTLSSRTEMARVVRHRPQGYNRRSERDPREPLMRPVSVSGVDIRVVIAKIPGVISLI